MPRWSNHIPSHYTLGVRLSDAEKNRLDALCAQTGQNQSALVRALIDRAEVALDGTPAASDVEHLPRVGQGNRTG